MERKKSSGCWIATLIVGAIVVLLVLCVGSCFWLFGSRKLKAEQEFLGEAHATEAELVRVRSGFERIELDESDWESLGPLEEGSPVSLKHFILTVDDPLATELARETFEERADGAPVSWLMKLRNVREEGGLLIADMVVPYSIKKSSVSGTTTTHGDLQVEGEFDPSQRDALIRLRQGDSLTVGGRLALDRREVRIVDAVVADPE